MAITKDEKTKTWYVRVSYSSGNGYKIKSKYGFKRKKDAEAWESKTRDQLKKKKLLREDTSFADYFMQWFNVYKSNKVADTTSDNYKATHAKITEYFKDKTLMSIRKIDYQAFINQYAETLAVGTIVKTHKQIRACVRDALHDGDLETDFTYKTEISGLEGKPEESKFLSHGETKRLIAAINDQSNGLSLTRRMALLSIATGMRFSEVAGLTFDRLDFENNTIKVDRTWHARKKIFKPTKTELNRTFAVEPSVMEGLRDFSIEQKKKELSTHMTNPNKLLFAQYDGTPPTNDAANKSLKRACRRAGVQEITFHSLRHIFVSIHIYKGMELATIAKRVGHKSAKTTAEFYAHIIEEMEDKSDELSNSIIKDLFS